MTTTTQDLTTNTLIYKATKGVVLHPLRSGVEKQPPSKNEVLRGINGIKGVIEYIRNETFIWQDREKRYESIEIYFMCGVCAIMAIQEYLRSLEDQFDPSKQYQNCLLEPYGKILFVLVPDFDSSLLSGHRHRGFPVSSYKMLCASQLGFYQFELDQEFINTKS